MRSGVYRMSELEERSKWAAAEYRSQKRGLVRRALLFFCAAIVAWGVCGGKAAQAATVSFNPSGGSFSSDTLTVDVVVNTEGVAINNAEAVIHFPSDALEVVSTSTTGSIFSLWIAGSKYSNEAGTLSFNAGKPTPGFNGSAGKILSIVFRIKKTSTATLTFSSVVIRANDGHGTNVFKAGTQATYALTLVEPTPSTSGEIVAPATPETLDAPIFTTYPSELQVGEHLSILGRVQPNHQVALSFQKDREGEEHTLIESGPDGRFTFAPDAPVREGVYRVWAESLNADGVRSASSERLAIVVKQPALESRFVVFFGVALLFILAIAFAWWMHILAKRRLRKETIEAESSLHKAFGSLRENRQRLEMFEAARAKRTLTDEEEKIVAWLKHDLDTAEQTVEKEIVDIEQEVK